MNTTKKFPPEVRERSVRMVFEQRGAHASQWAAIESIAPKIYDEPESGRTPTRLTSRTSGLVPTAFQIAVHCLSIVSEKP